MSQSGKLRIAPIGTTGRTGLSESDESGLLKEIGSVAETEADLILLPQLSFSSYFPVRRDREALELGERFPSRSIGVARRAARPRMLAASAYECVGEGVFYVTGQLGSEQEGTVLSQRQHNVEASSGRYEQMYFSPGHEARQAVDLPWGRTGMLIGADLSDPGAWSDLASSGVGVVLIMVSRESEGWARDRRVMSGFATAYGTAVCAVNRDPADDEKHFAGGVFACDAAGTEVVPSESGLIELSIPNHGSSTS